MCTAPSGEGTLYDKLEAYARAPRRPGAEGTRLSTSVEERLQLPPGKTGYLGHPENENGRPELAGRPSHAGRSDRRPKVMGQILFLAAGAVLLGQGVREIVDFRIHVACR